jgi:hypothetical protein
MKDFSADIAATGHVRGVVSGRTRYSLRLGRRSEALRKRRHLGLRGGTHQSRSLRTNFGIACIDLCRATVTARSHEKKRLVTVGRQALLSS